MKVNKKQSLVRPYSIYSIWLILATYHYYHNYHLGIEGKRFALGQLRRLIDLKSIDKSSTHTGESPTPLFTWGKFTASRYHTYKRLDSGAEQGDFFLDTTAFLEWSNHPFFRKCDTWCWRFAKCVLELSEQLQSSMWLVAQRRGGTEQENHSKPLYKGHSN